METVSAGTKARITTERYRVIMSVDLVSELAQQGIVFKLHDYIWGGESPKKSVKVEPIVYAIVDWKLLREKPHPNDPRPKVKQGDKDEIFEFDSSKCIAD